MVKLITKPICIIVSALILISTPIISSGCQSAISPTTPTTPITVTPATPTQPPQTEPTPAPKEVAKQVELKYDDSTGDIIQQIFQYPNETTQYGYLISFVPPSVPFTIQKLKLYGTARYCPV